MMTESGEKRKRGSASPDAAGIAADPSSAAAANAAANAAAQAPAPGQPRPVAPPRPLGTEEDLSHGQRPASDAARADRGIPVAVAADANAAAAAAAGAPAAVAAAAAGQAAAPSAAPPAAAAAAKLLVPGHSAWFRYYSVHRLEREALPEWFDGRQGGGGGGGAAGEAGLFAPGGSSFKTPESYLKLRNLLVDAYREDPLRRLTYTEARARAAAAAVAAAAAAAASAGGEAAGSGGEEASAPFDAAAVLRLGSHGNRKGRTERAVRAQYFEHPLVIGDVQRRLAVAQGIIVHAGQIVMDQRIDMHRLNRGAGAHGSGPVNSIHRGRGGKQQRPQPLAPANGGIAHRLIQPAARIGGHRQQRVKRRIDVALDLFQPLGEHRVSLGHG